MPPATRAHLPGAFLPRFIAGRLLRVTTALAWLFSNLCHNATSIPIDVSAIPARVTDDRHNNSPFRFVHWHNQVARATIANLAAFRTRDAYGGHGLGEIGYCRAGNLV